MAKTTITNGKTTGTEIYSIALEYGVTHTYKAAKYSCGHIVCKESFDVVLMEYVFDSQEFEYVIYEVLHAGKTMICIDIVFTETDCLCASCERLASMQFCNDPSLKPVGFESVVLYHGIAAYNFDDDEEVSAYDYYSRVVDIIRNPQWEICCSTRCIGHIGIVAKGEVLCASNADLFTEIDCKTGLRYFDKTRHRARHLIYDAKDLDPTVWSHDEIVTRDNKPTAIWVYSGASNTIKNYAIYIAKLLKIDCITVDEVLEVE